MKRLLCDGKKNFPFSTLNRFQSTPYRGPPSIRQLSDSIIEGTSVGRVKRLLNLDPCSSQLSKDKRTKIVCTIGLKTNSKESLRKLLLAGMNVVRLNASHGNHGFYTEVIENVRSCITDIRQSNTIDFSDGSREDFVALALDTKGPEIRTGFWSEEALSATTFADSDALPDRHVFLAKNEKVVVHARNSRLREQGSKEGEQGKEFQQLGHIYTDYDTDWHNVSPGKRVYVDDGSISLYVDEVDQVNKVLHCVAENSGSVGERKGLNLPGMHLGLPALTDKDVVDLEFAKNIGIDMVFASFIREAKNVEEIRAIVGDEMKIISKIENEEGLKNIDQIIQASDGIMVARGDLGIEIPIERVMLAQKTIALRCKIAGKPVICATQMLESMVKHAQPTRAECSDVGNAVYEGFDAVMLSGETANGDYPTQCVEIMSKICRTTEAIIDHQALSNLMRAINPPPYNTTESMAASAVVAAYQSSAKGIIVITESGKTAFLVEKYRPSVPLICCTANEATGRWLQILRDAQPLLIRPEMSVPEILDHAMLNMVQMGLCTANDQVIVLHTSTEKHDGDANVMKLLTIPSSLCQSE